MEASRIRAAQAGRIIVKLHWLSTRIPQLSHISTPRGEKAGHARGEKGFEAAISMHQLCFTPQDGGKAGAPISDLVKSLHNNPRLFTELQGSGGVLLHFGDGERNVARRTGLRPNQAQALAADRGLRVATPPDLQREGKTPQ